MSTTLNVILCGSETCFFPNGGAQIHCFGLLVGRRRRKRRRRKRRRRKRRRRKMRRRRKDVREHLKDLRFNKEFDIIMGLPPTDVVHITYVVRLLTVQTGFWVLTRPIFPWLRSSLVCYWRKKQGVRGYSRDWPEGSDTTRVSKVRIEADQRRNELERTQKVHPVVSWGRG